MRMTLHKTFIFCSGLKTFWKFVENFPDIACKTICQENITAMATA
jgi:hypothetical protein